MKKQKDEIIDRAVSGGFMSLSDIDVLYVALKPGMSPQKALNASRDIYHLCDNDLGNLPRFSCSELSFLTKLSIEKTSSLLASTHIAKRKAYKPDVKISRSKDVYDRFQYMADYSYEEFWVLLLARSNKIIKASKTGEGGLWGTVVDINKIATVAILNKSSRMILIHNHPSGNTQPSEADKKITNKLLKGLKLLDIDVVDHVIISSEGYYSFADEGILGVPE